MNQSEANFLTKTIQRMMNKGTILEGLFGLGDGQGSLVCYNLWGHEELDTTEWMNWTEACW